MRLYVAGPMTGYPEYNYPAFDAAQAQLRRAGYDAVSPAVHDITGEIKSWQFYERAALRLLLECDAVALLRGWSKSKGAMLEVRVARELEMPVKSLEEWL